MGEWQEFRLAETGRIITGKTPPTSNPEFYGIDIPFVTPSDMDGRRTIDRTTRRLSTLGVEKVRSSYVTEPAIVVSCIGSDMGKAALVNEPLVSNQQINSVIVSEGFDRLFLYYNLLARKDEIQDKASGAAQPIMNKTEFGNLVLQIPSLYEQSSISSVLGALDDKIELNRRTNETLEAMARALFRDWFVDFGPTRAKMAMRGEDPQKDNIPREPYLAPDLWALFPDRLDDATGLPEGWRNYTLNELADHHRAAVSPSAAPDTIFEHYSIPAHDAGNEPTLDRGESIKSNKTVVPDGAILLSKLNPEIERVWLPNLRGDAPQVASTEFLAFTPIHPATRSILYCLFRSERFRGAMAALVTGTSKSHQRVSPKGLLSRKVFAADSKLMPIFDDVCSPFLDRMLANRREARRLARTRDLLLPKLMSGKIRLRDAEKLAEEAAA